MGHNTRGPLKYKKKRGLSLYKKGGGVKTFGGKEISGAVSNESGS